MNVFNDRSMDKDERESEIIDKGDPWVDMRHK